MHISRIQPLKIVAIGGLYAVAGYFAANLFSYLLWQRYNYATNDPTGEVADGYAFCSKALLQATTALVAFLAGRSFQPTWITGVVTAVCASLLFRLTERFLFIGCYYEWESYRHNVLLTVVAAVVLGAFFGLLAVWKQIVLLYQIRHTE